MAWVRPPTLRSTERDEGRRATWLELFYDLVYVVAVAALAERLHHHADVPGFLVFAGLFLPVWWSWSGVTFYNDRFDTDDLVHRGATLLQMLGAAALAIHVDDALDGPGFALSYAGIRVILILQYARVARDVPHARALAVRYASGFGIAAALWVASAFLHGPARFAVWGVAMLIDIGTPLTVRAFQAKLPVSTSHLPERIGLFTIIVLGEGVAAVVGGAGTSLTASAAAAAALGLALAFGIWWIYFENLDDRVVRRTRVAGQVWFYGHYPLTLGLTAAAVGMELLIAAPPSEALDGHARWLLGGSVALCLLAMSLIHAATIDAKTRAPNTRRAVVRAASAALVLGATALLTSAPPLVFGGLVALVGVAQVAFDPPAQHATHAS